MDLQSSRNNNNLIPAEIIDEIIHHLRYRGPTSIVRCSPTGEPYDDIDERILVVHRTLYNFCLCCRQFALLGRDYLYETAILRSRRQLVLFLRTLSQDPDRGALIRALHWAGDMSHAAPGPQGAHAPPGLLPDPTFSKLVREVWPVNEGEEDDSAGGWELDRGSSSSPASPIAATGVDRSVRSSIGSKTSLENGVDGGGGRFAMVTRKLGMDGPPDEWQAWKVLAAVLALAPNLRSLRSTVSRVVKMTGPTLASGRPTGPTVYPEADAVATILMGPPSLASCLDRLEDLTLSPCADDRALVFGARDFLDQVLRRGAGRIRLRSLRVKGGTDWPLFFNETNWQPLEGMACPGVEHLSVAMGRTPQATLPALVRMFPQVRTFSGRFHDEFHRLDDSGLFTSISGFPAIFAPWKKTLQSLGLVSVVEAQVARPVRPEPFVSLVQMRGLTDLTVDVRFLISIVNPAIVARVVHHLLPVSLETLRLEPSPVHVHRAYQDYLRLSGRTGSKKKGSGGDDVVDGDDDDDAQQGTVFQDAMPSLGTLSVNDLYELPKASEVYDMVLTTLQEACRFTLTKLSRITVVQPVPGPQLVPEPGYIGPKPINVVLSDQAVEWITPHVPKFAESNVTLELETLAIDRGYFDSPWD